MTLSAEIVNEWVDQALAEDEAAHDATVAFLGIGDTVVNAELVAGSAGVLAGCDFARAAFVRADTRTTIKVHRLDGDKVVPGDVILSVRGPARSVLAAERVALNFLGRLSGIATLANAFVKAVSKTTITILDTRKTTPLWRDLEKYAVRVGGASNHRRDLGAMILVKENHRRAMGGRQSLLSHLNEHGRSGERFVEVEVDSFALLKDVLHAPVDRIMLDNFTPDMVAEAVALVNSVDPRPEVEVSGGITLDNIRAYLVDGVDFISVGALTHSAPALTASLEVRESDVI